MGSIPPELSLDLRASFVPKTIGDFLRDVSAIGNVADRASKLDELVKRLEEEMRKIDAFKRELPLCMLLLNDAIVALKEESEQCEARKISQPVLEEFIPLKKDCDEDEGLNSNNKKEKDCRDKKNWMSSVQLWNTDDDFSARDTTIDLKQNSKTQIKINEKRHGSETEDPFQGCRNRTVVGRAFVPFKPYSGYPAARKEEKKDEFPVHGLSLLTPGIKNLKEEPACGGNRSSNSSRPVSLSVSVSSSHSNLRAGSAQQQQAARKQRRCWSPELHRRFVSALQQLGGSQVATPKQIRELMQVDGLTNDEVKSHLQKYRLHTRRLPSASSASTPAGSQSVVVLGSLWMNQDQSGDSSKPSSSQSGSPQGPFQLGAHGGGSPTTGDESMEDDEDAKSEGYSWKSHSHKPGKDDVYES